MTNEIENCSVGLFTESECHLLSYTKKKSLNQFDSLTHEEKIFLDYRLDHKFDETPKNTICEHHKCVYLTYYTAFKYKCCEPFKPHKKIVKTEKVLELETCKEAMTYLELKLIPGDKICINCMTNVRQKIDSAKQKYITDQENNKGVNSGAECSVPLRSSERISKMNKVTYSNIDVDFNSQNSDQPLTGSSSSEFVTLSQDQENINTILKCLQLPTLKEYQIYKTKREKDAELMINDVHTSFVQKLSKATNIDLMLPEPITQSFVEDSRIASEMISNLQAKFSAAKTFHDKLEALALLPKHWNKKELSQYFNCSRYLYDKLLEFKKMDDFPDNIRNHKRKKYSLISSDMNQLVHEFYINDENAYTFPGENDRVIIRDSEGNKMYLQKKLLLYTVYDLFLKFKDEYDGTDKMPKFSHFASLKPKECIHAGDPGSHKICVCDQHQNIKLKLYALSRKINYRDLLVGAVCDIDSEECMIYGCSKCPGESGVKKVFNTLVTEQSIGLKTGDINYKNWVNAGSAASLDSFTANSEDLKAEIFRDINILTCHHFIADAQKKYLNWCKNNLKSNTCIIQMDFSENLSFKIRDSVQAYYYNNVHATVHPFCIYYKETSDGSLMNVNYVVISDTKDHVAYTINAFTKELMSVLKKKYDWIKNIIYFSDGAPQQYKNKNHLTNIMWHERDFNMKVVSYNFFATSHGKSICDAVGGTLKRQVTRHSIRAPLDRQITNAREMYEYAVENETSIKVLWVPDTEVKKYKRKLNQRSQKAETFPNTRQNHCYIPVNEKQMKVKITSFSMQEDIISL